MNIYKCIPYIHVHVQNSQEKILDFVTVIQYPEEGLEDRNALIHIKKSTALSCWLFILLPPISTVIELIPNRTCLPIDFITGLLHYSTDTFG